MIYLQVPEDIQEGNFVIMDEVGKAGLEHHPRFLVHKPKENTVRRGQGPHSRCHLHLPSHRDAAAPLPHTAFQPEPPPLPSLPPHPPMNHT